MLSIIISAFLSGLLGSFLTILWANRETKRKDKLEILTVLLSFRSRTDIFALSQISPAINRIPVIFANCPNIQSKMKDFIQIRNVFDLDKKPAEEQQHIIQQMSESYIKLVQAIATDLGYKHINFDIISNPYNPVGISEHFNLQHQNLQAQLKMMTNIAETTQAKPPQA